MAKWIKETRAVTPEPPAAPESTPAEDDKPPVTRWGEGHKRDVLDMYLLAYTLPQIEAKTGVPKSTIQKWIARYGWQGKKLEARAKTIARQVTRQKSDSTDLSTVEQITQAIHEYERLAFGDQQGDYRSRMAAMAIRVPLLIANLTDAGLLQHADKLEKLDKLARKALNLEEQKAAPILNVAILASAPIPPRQSAVIEMQSVPELSPPQEFTEESLRVTHPHAALQAPDSQAETPAT